jgi:hypothetical protein
MHRNAVARSQAPVAGAARPVSDRSFASRPWRTAYAAADRCAATGSKRNDVGMHPRPRRFDPLPT